MRAEKTPAGPLTTHGPVLHQLHRRRRCSRSGAGPAGPTASVLSNDQKDQINIMGEWSWIAGREVLQRLVSLEDSPATGRGAILLLLLGGMLLTLLVLLTSRMSVRDLVSKGREAQKETVGVSNISAGRGK